MRAEPEPEDDGVDVTLIRWMLSLSPEERLAALQGFVDSIAALQGFVDSIAALSDEPSDA
jgi:hypothetical protein